jgi:hypothetical protein
MTSTGWQHDTVLYYIFNALSKRNLAIISIFISHTTLDLAIRRLLASSIGLFLPHQR